MGLMGRSSLPPGDGLWLPDSNGIHMMFMRFPIDAVFVSSGPDRGSECGTRNVLSVASRAADLGGYRAAGPGRRRACWSCPVGTIDATGTVVGDVIDLSVGADVPA